MRDVGGDTEVVEVREDLRLPYKEGVDPRLPCKEIAGTLDRRGVSLARSRRDLGAIWGRSRADLFGSM